MRNFLDFHKIKANFAQDAVYVLHMPKSFPQAVERGVEKPMEKSKFRRKKGKNR